MVWPSTLSTFSNPLPTDRLNSPSHSSVETAQNTGITQVETFIGTLPASAVGTVLYDVRSPDSDGGGHVQTAVKGGTGQTSFVKGDILVATSGSVLSKLAVGSDGQVLKSNSSVASGIQWGAGAGTKVANSASVIFMSSITAETSVMSTTISGSTLGTDGAIRGTLFVTDLRGDNGNDVFTLRPMYGSSSITTITISSLVGAGAASIKGTVTFNLVANSAANSQRGTVVVNLAQVAATNLQVPSSVFSFVRSLVISEDSATSLPFGITGKWNIAQTTFQFATAGYTVEKIV